VDLLTTPQGTLFASGQYTLELAGTVSTAGVDAAGLAIQTVAIPEPSTLLLMAGALGLLGFTCLRAKGAA
jgi:hypothetical protein